MIGAVLSYFAVIYLSGMAAFTIIGVPPAQSALAQVTPGGRDWAGPLASIVVAVVAAIGACIAALIASGRGPSRESRRLRALEREVAAMKKLLEKERAAK